MNIGVITAGSAKDYNHDSLIVRLRDSGLVAISDHGTCRNYTEAVSLASDWSTEGNIDAVLIIGVPDGGGVWGPYSKTPVGRSYAPHNGFGRALLDLCFVMHEKAKRDPDKHSDWALNLSPPESEFFGDRRSRSRLNPEALWRDRCLASPEFIVLSPKQTVHLKEELIAKQDEASRRGSLSASITSFHFRSRGVPSYGVWPSMLAGMFDRKDWVSGLFSSAIRPYSDTGYEYKLNTPESTNPKPAKNALSKLLGAETNES